MTIILSVEAFSAAQHKMLLRETKLSLLIHRIW